MNVIVVEQKPEAAKLAIQVHSNSAITRMRVRSAKLLGQSLAQKPEGATIDPKFHFKSRVIEAQTSFLLVRIDFRFQGIVQGKTSTPSAKPLVDINCSYEVTYEIREGFDLTEKHAAAFAGGNAIFNAWPFFREFLHTSLQRMGFPPLTAPFLRLQVSPPPKEGKLK